jgi:cell wall-associated NlpC family hydrolase
MNDKERDERARVVAIALTWERTPYRHGAHLKGKACDCTFVADVYEEAGLIGHVDIEVYSPQFMLNQREEKYLGYVQRYAHEIAGPPQPGDLVLYKFGRVLSHSAIVIFPGWPSVIHAGQKESIVTRAEGDKGMLGLSPVHRRFFSFWD